MSDHDFLPLDSYELLDAGEEGLAVYLSVRRPPPESKTYQVGLLLDAEKGKDFLLALASAMARKYPEKVKWFDPPEGSPH